MVREQGRAKMTNHTIGVDISKDYLDVHCLGDGQAARFGNGAAGFRALEAWLPEGIIDRLVYEGEGTAITGPITRRSRSGLRPAIRWSK